MSDATERREHPEPIGVGMPYWLRLCEFGALVCLAWGHTPMLVGSALEKRDPRDIDVRLMLTYPQIRRTLGAPEQVNFAGTPWAAHCLAWSALGTQMVGKPIDFQIQTEDAVIKYKSRPRLPLLHICDTAWLQRTGDPEQEETDTCSPTSANMPPSAPVPSSPSTSSSASSSR